MNGLHLGIDIGGTKIDAVITTFEGEVVHRHTVPSAYGNDAVVSAVIEVVAQLCEASAVALADVSSIGVGVPGAVQDGVVGHAVNLEITSLALADTLEAVWGKRPVIDNDVNAAAVGTWVVENRAVGSMAFLNLGTGLATGLILNGALWHGARGAAGEIGYVSVDPTGPPDMDGLRGGLETYAGGCGIVLQAQHDGVSAMEILTRADEVPAWATIRDSLFFGVASAVRMLVLTVDVEEVVLGGGLTGMGDDLLEGVRSVLRGWAQFSPFLASTELDQRVRLLATDAPVAAIGAAMRGAGRG